MDYWFSAPQLIPVHLYIVGSLQCSASVVPQVLKRYQKFHDLKQRYEAKRMESEMTFDCPDMIIYLSTLQYSITYKKSPPFLRSYRSKSYIWLNALSSGSGSASGDPYRSSKRPRAASTGAPCSINRRAMVTSLGSGHHLVVDWSHEDVVNRS